MPGKSLKVVTPQKQNLVLTTKYGGRVRMNHPFQNRAPLGFLDIFLLLKLRKNRNSLPDFPLIFCAVHFRVISKKHFFWGTTPYSGLCNSAHTCSKFLFLLDFLVQVHIFNLVQFLGQYLFSTSSYGFLKNDSLLSCCSSPKRTEKQDLLFTKIALTRLTN